MNAKVGQSVILLHIKHHTFNIIAKIAHSLTTFLELIYGIYLTEFIK